jgi:high-affinity iron transporter
MFLNAVILILQEILEAALLISVLLVLTRLLYKIWNQDLQITLGAIYIAAFLGGAGAWLYAIYTPSISEWFDYVGQEVVNASLHVVSLILLIILAYLIPSKHFSSRALLQSRAAIFCMLGVVLLALVREGSEIILYIGGFSAQPENFSPVLFGGLIGGGIGVSSGIFLYYTLSSLRHQWSLKLCLLLLALISGNMASQVVLLLTQADWLPYTPIAWDTSMLLTESSVTGHLLYALIGYEATPSWLQVMCYIVGVIMIMVSPLVRTIWPARVDGEKENLVEKRQY